VGSAAFALGKALVNSVPVGVVGNDEDAAVGPCCSRKESHACQNDGKNPNCGESMHEGREKGEVMAESATENTGRFRGEIRRLWGAT
jgi:hypothetical protein